MTDTKKKKWLCDFMRATAFYPDSKKSSGMGIAKLQIAVYILENAKPSEMAKDRDRMEFCESYASIRENICVGHNTILATIGFLKKHHFLKKLEENNTEPKIGSGKAPNRYEISFDYRVESF